MASYQAMKSFQPGGATRLSLSPEELETVKCLCVLWCLSPLVSEDKDVERIIPIQHIAHRLDTDAGLLEGFHVLPSTPKQTVVLLVCREKVDSKIIGSSDPVAHFLRSYRWSDPGETLSNFDNKDHITVVSKTLSWSHLVTQEPTLCQDISTELVLGLTKGQSHIEGWNWYANTECVVASTPSPEEHIPPEFIKQFSQLQQIVLDLRKELEEFKTHPLPTPPDPNISIGDQLAKSITDHSEQLIKSLSTKGVFSSHAPKLQALFSGEHMKGDSSFETWEFEVTQLTETHSDEVVKQSILKSLRGNALEALRSLSPNLAEISVQDILGHLRSKYGISSSFDTMMKKFYLFSQKDEEDVSQFSTRIESVLRDIRFRFPQKIPSEQHRLDILKDRFFYGCRDAIRNAIMFKFKEEKVGFRDLLAIAREVESALEADGVKSKTEKVTEKKAQVKSEVVSSIDPSLSKLIGLAKQCELEQARNTSTVQSLTEAFKDYEQRNNVHHVPYAQRGNGNSNGNGRGTPNYNNPNPRYLGNSYDPNYRGRGGQGRGGQGRGGPGRGGFRGTGQRPNQNQNFQYFQPAINQAQNPQNPPQNQQAPNANANPNQNAGQNNQRRQPYCRFCTNQGFPQTDHWPNQCQFLETVTTQWRQTQNDNGHQNQAQNLNG